MLRNPAAYPNLDVSRALWEQHMMATGSMNQGSHYRTPGEYQAYYQGNTMMPARRGIPPSDHSSPESDVSGTPDWSQQGSTPHLNAAGNPVMGTPIQGYSPYPFSQYRPMGTGGNSTPGYHHTPMPPLGMQGSTPRTVPSGNQSGTPFRSPVPNYGA